MDLCPLIPMATRSGTPARTGIRGRYLSGFRPRILARIDKRQFHRRVGLYPYRQHKGRKLVLGDRTEALVYILAHEARHMWQAARDDEEFKLPHRASQERPRDVLRSLH